MTPVSRHFHRHSLPVGGSHANPNLPNMQWSPTSGQHKSNHNQTPRHDPQPLDYLQKFHTLAQLFFKPGDSRPAAKTQESHAPLVGETSTTKTPQPKLDVQVNPYSNHWEHGSATRDPSQNRVPKSRRGSQVSSAQKTAAFYHGHQKTNDTKLSSKYTISKLKERFTPNNHGRQQDRSYQQSESPKSSSRRSLDRESLDRENLDRASLVIARRQKAAETRTPSPPPHIPQPNLGWPREYAPTQGMHFSQRRDGSFNSNQTHHLPRGSNGSTGTKNSTQRPVRPAPPDDPETTNFILQEQGKNNRNLPLANFDFNPSNQPPSTPAILDQPNEYFLPNEHTSVLQTNPYHKSNARLPPRHPLPPIPSSDRRRRSSQSIRVPA